MPAAEPQNEGATASSTPALSMFIATSSSYGRLSHDGSFFAAATHQGASKDKPGAHAPPPQTSRPEHLRVMTVRPATNIKTRKSKSKTLNRRIDD